MDHIQETKLHGRSGVSRKNNGAVSSIATSLDHQAGDVSFKLCHYVGLSLCCVVLAASNHVK